MCVRACVLVGLCLYPHRSPAPHNIHTIFTYMPRRKKKKKKRDREEYEAASEGAGTDHNHADHAAAAAGEEEQGGEGDAGSAAAAAAAAGPRDDGLTATQRRHLEKLRERVRDIYGCCEGVCFLRHCSVMTGVLISPIFTLPRPTNPTGEDADEEGALQDAPRADRRVQPVPERADGAQRHPARVGRWQRLKC